MKNIFLNTLFLFVSIITFAQTSDISISVKDAETNEPLLGATVYFEELEKNEFNKTCNAISITKKNSK